jgi:hypothetical protein
LFIIIPQLLLNYLVFGDARQKDKAVPLAVLRAGCGKDVEKMRGGCEEDAGRRSDFRSFKEDGLGGWTEICLQSDESAPAKAEFMPSTQEKNPIRTSASLNEQGLICS